MVNQMSIMGKKMNVDAGNAVGGVSAVNPA
jgi:hypothetical protein